MKRLLNHPFVQNHGAKIAKFIVSGGIGATIDLTSQWILVEYAHLPPVPIFILSASFGATFVFFFNKFITFKNYESAGNQVMKFVIIYVPAIGLNFVLSSLFFYLGAPHEIAKAIAIGIGAVINYILSTTFIFKKKIS